MKLRSIIILAAIPIALLFQGCSTPPRITSNELQKLAYEQTFSEFQKQIGTNVMDCLDFFTILRTNTVYNCKMISVFDTQKSYLLLFQDGVFVSMFNTAEERRKTKWRGFSSLTQPDFTEVDARIESFFPPPMLSTFQFTNSSNLDLARSKQEQDDSEAEGIVMAIGLAPIAIAVAPVTLPIVIYQQKKQSKWTKHFESLKMGTSETDVKQLLGDPKKIFGSQDESIWVYKNMWGCLGFENGKLVWIMNDYEPNEFLRH
jgi:hypothetical protein